MVSNIHSIRKVSAACAAIIALISLGGAGLSWGATQPMVIKAKEIAGPIPKDAHDPEWIKAPDAVLPLSSQIISVPRWYNAAVKNLSVKAMINGKEIGIRLEWLDPTRNDTVVRTEDFRDSAAIQFPVKPAILPDKPYIAMGDAEGLVNIWHWKADWQADAGKMRDIEDVFPDGAADLYLEEKDGKVYYSGVGSTRGLYHGGVYSNNILSKAQMRISAAEDLNALGFGTLTTQESQDVKGNGYWDGNKWSMVFLRSIATQDKNDVQFTEFKDYIPVAFAIWEGSNGERDGQKAVSTWHYLKLR